MIQLAAGVLQAGLDVFRLQVRQLLENLLRGQPIGEQIQDIRHPDAHSANAGVSAALGRIGCDSFQARNIPLPPNPLKLLLDRDQPPRPVG